MKRTTLLILCIFVLLSSILILNAKDYKVAVAQLPTTDTYVALLKAIGDETKNNFVIETMPMARAVYLVEAKQTDLQCPQAEVSNIKKQQEFKYDYSTVTVYKLGFVLYSNKSKNITIDELKKGNPKNYKIETEISHINYFDFQCIGSSNIEASLKKVDSGQIDGFIFAMTSTDKVLKSLGLKNIKRQLYDYFNNKFLLPKGTRGGELDKVLSDGIAKLKANGKLEKLMGDLIRSAETYDNWQP